MIRLLLLCSPRSETGHFLKIFIYSTCIFMIVPFKQPIKVKLLTIFYYCNWRNLTSWKMRICTSFLLILSGPHQFWNVWKPSQVINSCPNMKINNHVIHQCSYNVQVQSWILIFVEGGQLKNIEKSHYDYSPTQSK